MKIAIFHLAFVYSGGGEKLVIEQAKKLEEQGHEVTIYTPVINRKESFPDLINKVQVKTFIPFFNSLFFLSEQFRIVITCFFAPVFAFRFRNYDVILAANQPSPWNAWVVKEIFGVPYVSYLAQPTRFLYPRDIDNELGLYFVRKEAKSWTEVLMKIFRKFINWADHISIKNSDMILANGEYIKNKLEKIYKIEAESCAAGASFVDKPLSNVAKNKGKVKAGKSFVNKPFVLITNRHFSQKRFEHGIVAFASVAGDHKDLRLVITGKATDYTKELKVLISRLNISDRVIFTGYIPDSEVKKLYRHALVYLYTAPEEDFGMGVIESMGQGTPVIAWDNGGPSFTVINNKTGYLIDIDNVGDFSQKLEKLINDKDRRGILSKQSVKHVKNNYSWNYHIECLENALYKALD